MGKIRKYVSNLLPLIIMILIGVPLIIHEKREDEIEKTERKAIRKVYGDSHSQAMTKNEHSLKIGAELERALVLLDDETDVVTYSIMPKSREDGIRKFDSLVVEVCKYHCESIISYTYTNRDKPRFSSVFRCGNLRVVHYSDHYIYDGDTTEFDNIDVKYKLEK
jgi:hypothetical protein